MIYKASFEESKYLDRSRYLICFISKKIPKNFSCDYLLKDLLPKPSLYRSFETKEITEGEFIDKYKNYLKNPSKEIPMTEIIDLLNRTSKILLKDIVLCGGNLCNIVCESIEEVGGIKINNITE